jgi:hypothetical protein
MDSWEREPYPSDGEAPLAPTAVPVLGVSASTQNNTAIVYNSPPFISGGVEPAGKNFGPKEMNANPLEHDIFAGIAAAESATNSKAPSLSRTVAFFGVLSFAAGFGLGALLLAKPDLNARPSSEPIALVASTQTTPMVASAPESNLSETVNHLKSVGAELTSLRQDIRSLASELAQIREAQQDLMATLARKSLRPESRTSDRRNSRGKAANNPAPAGTLKTNDQTSTEVP